MAFKLTATVRSMLPRQLVRKCEEIRFWKSWMRTGHYYDFDGLIEYSHPFEKFPLSMLWNILLQLNDSVQARYTVKRGSRNLKDIGNIIGVNSETMLNVFKDDPRCNVFNGTDKTIFPPLQEKNEIVWTYSNDACKSFPLRFRYKKTLRNIRTAFKNALFTDPLVITENVLLQWSVSLIVIFWF